MFSWLFGNSAKLNQLETRLIDEIARALPETSGQLLRLQAQLMNKVQRLDQDREVDLYRMEKGKPSFPESMLFADRSDEYELARLKLTDAETGHGTKVVVSLVKGRLFCFEFAQSPRELKGSANLQVIVERIADPGTSEAPRQKFLSALSFQFSRFRRDTDNFRADI